MCQLRRPTSLVRAVMAHRRTGSLLFLKRTTLYTGAAIVALLTAACAHQGKPYDSMDYRAGRSGELAAISAWQTCRNDALTMDESARNQGSSAQYATAAQTMDYCLAQIDPHRDVVDEKSRMQLHALSVLDFFKAGDLDRARLQLYTFLDSYPGKDLYLANGRSATDSFAILLGQARDTTPSHQVMNIDENLKSEMLRLRYWDSH